MKPSLILLLILALGLFLRLDFLVANNFVIDADEAIVGLMGLHISHGAEWPTFYYGQHYMGSLEPLMAAGLFELAGPSNAALALVPLLWSLLLIILVYSLAKDCDGQRAGLYAALLTAIAPASLIVWSAKARGGFIEVVVLGALALRVAFLWLDARGASIAKTALLGFILGIGWWVNNQIIYFMLPCALVLAFALMKEGLFTALKSLMKHAAVGGAAFLAGGAPFWIYNLRHDFASFGMFRRASLSSLSAHIEGFFGTALPMLFGAKRFWQLEEVFPGAVIAGFVLYGICVLGVLVVRGGDLAQGIRVKDPRGLKYLLLFAFAAAASAIFVTSSFGYLYEAPRYLLPLYAGLFPLIGVFLAALHRRSPAVSSLLLVGILGLHLSSCYLGGRAIPGEPFVFGGERVSKDHSELLAWLEEKRIGWIRTNYWIGYRVAFETSEKVKFLIYQEPHHARIPDYIEQGTEFGPERMPIVLVPAQAQILRDALTVQGYRFEELILSGYHVFLNIAPSQHDLVRIPSSEVTVHTSVHEITQHQLLDHDLGTRWGSGSPQSPGMEVRLSFASPKKVRGLRYDLAAWPHDFPRDLVIMGVRPDGNEIPLLPPGAWGAVHYAMERENFFEMFFSGEPLREIKLIQIGKDPVFDWSIAELSFYE